MILGLATLMGGMMVSSVRADEPVEARTIYHPGGSTSAFEDEYGKGRPIGRDTATNEVHRGVTLGFYAPAGKPKLGECIRTTVTNYRCFGRLIDCLTVK